MLIEFSVENFKCFKEKVTFSMVADAELRNLDFDKLDAKDQLLNVAAIYGANASGKSSLIEAMAYLKFFATKSATEIPAGEETGIKPYIFDGETIKNPSYFKILFLIDGKQYGYELKLDRAEVFSETLYFWEEDNKKVIFKRNEQEIEFPLKDKNPSTEEEQEEKILLKLYIKQTRQNVSFLSKASDLNDKTMMLVSEWLGRHLDLPTEKNSASLSTAKQLLLDTEFKKRVMKYLNYAHIPVLDLNVKDKKMGNNVFFIHDANVNIAGTKFNASLPLEDESDGTQRYFQILASIDNALKYPDMTLIFDELDYRLHPLLVKAIVNLFNNKKTNPHKTQLIFTTHNADLLVGDLFELDQIWFVDRKGKPKASELYSLAEFGDMPDKVDNDPDLVRRQYLQGRFGAIPYVGGEPDLWE